MSDPSEAFSPKKALADLVRRQPNKPVRKLAFFDQCAAFYALFGGARPHIVAKAFGISPTATSQIAGCLARDPRPQFTELADGKIVKNRDHNKNRSPARIQRYGRVADEFKLLGEEAFGAKYYTEEIHLRLKRIEYELDDEALRRARQGPDPAADEGLSSDDFAGDRADYLWLDNDGPPGWYIVGTHMSFGREFLEGGERRPFARKKDARDAAWKMNGYPNGAPKNNSPI